MPVPPEIRALVSGDADAYWHLRLEALEREPAAFSRDAEEHRATSVEDVRARWRAEPADHFIIGGFVDSELVGTAGLYRGHGPKERHKGHVWGVYVTAAARGRGIGRAMLEALVARARVTEGLEQIVIRVTSTQAAALALYESLGFRRFGCEPRSLKVGERYVDEHALVLFIDNSEA